MTTYARIVITKLLSEPYLGRDTATGQDPATGQDLFVQLVELEDGQRVPLGMTLGLAHQLAHSICCGHLPLPDGTQLASETVSHAVTPRDKRPDGYGGYMPAPISRTVTSAPAGNGASEPAAGPITRSGC
jgi:hypothetical protein